MHFIAATRQSVSRSLRHYICLRMQFRGGFLQFKSAPARTTDPVVTPGPGLNRPLSPLATQGQTLH